MPRRRTRFRVVPSAVQKVEHVSTHAYAPPLIRQFQSSPTNPVLRRSETIVDTAGKRRAGKRWKRYQPSSVDHTTVRFLELNAPRYGPPSQIGRHNRFRLGPYPDGLWVQSQLGQFTSRLITSTAAEMSEFADAAFQQMAAQMPEEISIPNFILEAKEIGSVFPDLRAKMSRTDVAKNGLLSWEFGLKPLLSDLQTISSLLDTVRNRIQFLKDTRGKRVRLGAYFVRERELPQPILTGYGGALQNTSGLSHDLVAVYHHSTYRASGYLYHELEGLDDIGGLLRALMVATGFGNPLKVAWNAIPYSFVVDWVTNASDLLSDASRIKPFMGPWQVSDFCYSVTDVLGFVVSARPSNPLDPNSPHDLPADALGRVEFKRYRREVGVPARVISLSLPLSAREALLAAALLR